MSDYRNQYNEESARVAQQAVKPLAAPQQAQPVQQAPYMPPMQAQPAAPVRRRRSDRYTGGEQDAPTPAYQAPAPQQEYQAPVQEYASPIQEYQAPAPQQDAQWAPQQQWKQEEPWTPQQQPAFYQEQEQPQHPDPYYAPRGNQRAPYVDDAFARRPVALDDEYDEDDDERRSPILKILLIVVAVLIALAAVLYFAPIPEDNFLYPAKKLVDDGVGAVKNLISPEKDPADQVYSFETIQNNGMTNSRLMFRLTTTKNVEGAMLRDEAGNEIPATVNRLTNLDADPQIWNISTEFATPFQGQVFAYVKLDGQWEACGQSVSLMIVSPTLPPSLPTQAPTLAPTMAPTQMPTLVPTNVPANTPVTNLVIVTWAPTSTPAPTMAPTAEPTAVPTQVPTPEPTAVPTPVPTLAPTAEPTKTPMPQLEAQAGANNIKMTDTVYKGGTSQSDYQRKEGYMAPHPDDYTWYESGVLTFRGDNFRRNAAFGTVEVEDEKLSILWKSEIGSLRTADNGTLYGVGWSGQPAIVKWTKQVREMMDSLYDEKQATSAFREVIFGAQDGKIYFLDLTDGSASRDPISIGYPIKGSVSIDPYVRPLLAVGQGISKLPSKQGDIGVHVFNLIDNEKAFFVNGRQSNSQKQYSTNGAFDGTPLMLYSYGPYANDAIIMAGENGLLYTIDLNSDFSYPTPDEPDKVGSLEVNQETYYLRSKMASAAADKAKNQVGVESSVAMYNQYIYLADTYGLVRCVDSDTMQTVWAVDTGDNVDAAIALDMNDKGEISLYTGNTAYSRLGSKKDVTIRRLDALTGDEIWNYTIKCDYDKNQLSGCKASPVIGQHEIAGLVIFTVNQVDDGESRVIAFNKENGKVAWHYDLAAETVSSPVAVYNEAGEAWIIQADGDGTLYLFDGLTGSLRNKLELGGEIQGSPAVYKDILVIGTCSKDNSYMYGIKIN